MSHTFVAVLAASLSACSVTTIGIYVIGRYEEWGRRNTVYFMSFAAGVLVSDSFLHIVPASFQMHAGAPAFLLAGFLALHLLNRFLDIYICQEHGSDITVGIVPMIGIGFHSLLDGLIYAVTFNVDIFTGVLAAVGMVLHEFPEGIVTFLLLERGGRPRGCSLSVCLPWLLLVPGMGASGRPAIISYSSGVASVASSPMGAPAYRMRPPGLCCSSTRQRARCSSCYSSSRGSGASTHKPRWKPKSCGSGPTPTTSPGFPTGAR